VRGRVARALCLLATVGGVSAAASAPALAGDGVPFTVDYQGVYTYHEDSQQGGKPLSTVDQTFGWDWHAAGEVPVGLDGAESAVGLDGAESANLPGRLIVTGQETTTGASTPPTKCTYSAGDEESSAIRLSLDASDPFGDGVGYGIGIPGAVATCGGVSPGPDNVSDVLACDFKTCDAGICPAGPPAVSADRYKTPVLTAFEPTTSYTKSGYVSLRGASGLFGTVTTPYNLPRAEGLLNTSCQSDVAESVRMTISSAVTVSILQSDLYFNFKDGEFPNLGEPGELIHLEPGRSDIPLIYVPPKSQEPPPISTPPAPPMEPAVGVITIRCPRRVPRCKGEIVVTGGPGAPRGTLGHRTYSLAGGEDNIMSVGLGGAAAAVLAGSGKLQVHVEAIADTASGESRGARNVVVTAFKPILGTPRG
jgi:hypothetical protein